eukprot:5882650-Lingulodinium_polyedra.AAC.1
MARSRAGNCQRATYSDNPTRRHDRNRAACVMSPPIWLSRNLLMLHIYGCKLGPRHPPAVRGGRGGDLIN